MLFKSVPTNRLSSVSGLRDLLKGHQANQWTGFVEVSPSSGSQFWIILSGGTVICAYSFSMEQAEKIEPSMVDRALSRALEYEVASVALTPSALRMVKILAEQRVPARTVQVKTGQLGPLLSQWGRQSHPSLVVCHWPTAHYLAVLPPRPGSLGEAVFLSQADPLADQDARSHALAWKDPTVDGLCYNYSNETPAWEEYNLHLAFTEILESIMERYKELTGLALLNALGRNVNRVALEHKFEIDVTLGKISDQAVFFGVSEAVLAYQTLNAIALDHIGIVLGRKLLQSTLREATASLDANLVHLAQKYNLLISVEPIGADAAGH